MKKTFLLLCFAFMSLSNAGAQMVLPTIYPDLVISIKPTKPKVPITPVSIVQPDIEACYRNEALTLIFNKDLGDADIVVTNLTTGDIWSGSATGICSTTILLSGDEGYYQISIFTDNEEYFGEFSL